MSKLVLNPHKSAHKPDFARRNIIAAEIEKVIDALRSLSASTCRDGARARRDGERARVRCRFSAEFLKKLDRF